MASYVMFDVVRLLHALQSISAVVAFSSFAHPNNHASCASTLSIATTALYSTAYIMASFLGLPPELRLHVYQYLLITSIADGRAADAAGLLFTCQTVYSEMRTDFIPAVAIALSALSQWNSSYTESPLKIDLPRDYNFRQPPTNATIRFPYGPQWFLIGDEQLGLEHAIKSLKLLLCQSWNCLTFRVYYPFTSESFLVTMDDVDTVIRVLFGFMRQESRVKGLKKSHFFRTKRLVFSMDTRFDPEATALTTLRSMSSLYGDCLTSLFEPHMARHSGSITQKITHKDDRTCVTWSLGYELDTVSE